MADSNDGYSLYNYKPSVAASVVFALVFGISAGLHVWQAFIRARAWFFTAFIVGSFSTFEFIPGKTQEELASLKMRNDP